MIYGLVVGFVAFPFITAVLLGISRAGRTLNRTNRRSSR